MHLSLPHRVSIDKLESKFGGAPLWPSVPHPKQERTLSSFCSRITSLLPLLTFSFLAACGGGGGSSSPISSAQPPSAPSSGTAPPYTVRSGVWVVMGSSTAAGNGAPPDKGWVAVLGQTLSDRGIQVVNIARAGTVTYNGLSSSTAPTPNRPAPDAALNIDQALSRKPVALMLAYPTNDTGLGYSLDETVNNLMAIRATALASSVPVMVLSTQPRNLPDAQRATLKDINVRLASEVGPCFVNVYDSLAGPDGRLLPSYDSGDGTHPNEAGHRVIATIMQTAIENAKCISVVR
jgi:acyl-CoA thioesterase-1